MIVFFAGAESPKVRKALYECGVKNILVSYYYLNRTEEVNEIFSMFDRIAIDSGAFTMLDNVRKSKSNTVNHNKYISKYIDFVSKHIGKFFFIVNYDIENIVGVRRVNEWNKEFEQLEKAGQQVCYVAHEHAEDPLLFKRHSEYIEKYNYIGSSGAAKAIDHALAVKTYTYSRKHNTKVHGFGYTAFTSQRMFPFYSSDSTTYLGSARYGSTYVWNGMFFETWGHLYKHYRKQIFPQCRKWGLSIEKILNEDSEELLRFSILSWKANIKKYNKVTAYKQWWLTPKERKKILLENIDG